MDEPVGAQYAVHVALETLKNRCKNLQEMVGTLEEENLHLKGQLSHTTEHNSVSVSDFDKLKAQITELTENKLQLLNKVKMVTHENQELWTKLSRLSHVNHNLGTQLNKINDSIVQYTAKNKEPHSPLIRSKTFTQDEPHTKVLQKNIEENGKICAELEEISLKIINRFEQEKNELDSLYSDIRDMQWGDNIITDSCGFFYEDYDNNITDSIKSMSEELKATKETAASHKTALLLIVKKMENLKEIKKKKICDSRKTQSEMVDKGTCTIPLEDTESQNTPLPAQAVPESDINDSSDSMTMICPLCSKNFDSVNFLELQQHVETHFSAETFEML